MEDPFNNNIQKGDAWLANRKTHIGSSDIGTIMGSNPYRDAMDLWEEKVGIKQPEDLSGNYNVQRGNTYEPVARAFAEQKYNCKFEPVNFRHPSFKFCGGSADGYNPETDTILEIKCPQAKGVKAARGGEIPQHYLDQIYWLMLASGAKKGVYQVYDVEGDESIFIPVMRDEARIKELVAAAADFWKCVETKTPPTAARPTTEFENDAAEFISAKALRDRAIEQYDAIKERLEGHLKQSGQESFAGHGIKIVRSFRKGSVEYAKIPVLKGMNLDQYRKKDVEIITVEVL